MQTNVAKPDHIKAASIKEKISKGTQLDDVKWILSTPQGRRFIWRYLGECGLFRSSFQGQFQTFFHEGERNIGLKLLADINDADPQSYVTMMTESKREGNK